MIRTTSLLALTLLALACPWRAAEAALVDLEDLVLAPNSFHNTGSFISRGTTFNNSTPFGPGYWEGFSYSNTTDTVTPGFGNQYSAITGIGAGGSANYAVAFDPEPFAPVPSLNLPATQYPISVLVTNTTYTYRAIVDGNDGGANFARQFGDDPNTVSIHGNEGFPDQLTLTITGRDSSNAITGSVNVLLADYTSASNASDYAIDDWLAVDLTALGTNTRALQFSMTSTDSGPFGANTPLYFALDNLVTAVDINSLPEPSAWASGLLVAAAALAYGLRRVQWRKEKSHAQSDVLIAE